MPREKAIVLIECSANKLRETLKETTMHSSASEQIQMYIDAYEMAISALRQQEAVTKCNDLFDEDGGDILQDETVTDHHQMTNADRLNAMTIEEKAEALCKELGLNYYIKESLMDLEEEK